MKNDGIKGKIEKFIDKPIVTIEKTIKDIGEDEKFVEFIDDPGITVEKGLKKSWEYIIYTGKEIKSNMTKKRKKKRKKNDK